MRHLHAMRLHGVALAIVVLAHVRVVEIRHLRRPVAAIRGPTVGAGHSHEFKGGGVRGKQPFGLLCEHLLLRRHADPAPLGLGCVQPLGTSLLSAWGTHGFTGVACNAMTVLCQGAAGQTLHAHEQFQIFWAGALTGAMVLLAAPASAQFVLIR